MRYQAIIYWNGHCNTYVHSDNFMYLEKLVQECITHTKTQTPRRIKEDYIDYFDNGTLKATKLWRDDMITVTYFD